MYPDLPKPALAEEPASFETGSLPALKILETTPAEIVVASETPPPKNSKKEIRRSLKASTWDGVFATIFSNITGGVLLSNFLLELDATPVEIGLLSSIPMLVNLLQPLGAYLSDRTTSRHWYGMAIFGPSRLLWLILVLGIGWLGWSDSNSHVLVHWTLGIIFITNLLGAMGGASWLSWMASLVPRQLRGRYFGIRNSATSLTNLISVPLLGLAVSAWPGGSIQGYGAILIFGVAIGIVSLCCQFWIADVNPQEQEKHEQAKQESRKTSSSLPRLQPDFLKFLLYFGFWMFALNIGSPFFNLYMLDNLHVDVSWVTIYGSVAAGANMLLLVTWGKLADKIGNRPLLILVGVLVALTPLLWILPGSAAVSLWVWFPLLHLFMGGTGAAVDLCSSNLQLDVAPKRNQATNFAIVAAVAGVCGAVGTTAGGFIAELPYFGGLQGLFAISAVLRLLALVPLFFLKEHRSVPLNQLMQKVLAASQVESLFPSLPRLRLGRYVHLKRHL